MQWLTSIADELGGPDRVRAMLRGEGVSFILKSINVNFKRPVVFPDTVSSSLYSCHPVVLPEYTRYWLTLICAPRSASYCP
jgi:hypothetical protein